MITKGFRTTTKCYLRKCYNSLKDTTFFYVTATKIWLEGSLRIRNQIVYPKEKKTNNNLRLCYFHSQFQHIMIDTAGHGHYVPDIWLAGEPSNNWTMVCQTISASNTHFRSQPLIPTICFTRRYHINNTLQDFVFFRILLEVGFKSNQGPILL